MPDLPRRIVGRAVAVPDHVGDDGGAMVGNDDDLEAVVESEMGDLRGGSVSGHRNPRSWRSPPRRAAAPPVMTIFRHIGRRRGGR